MALEPARTQDVVQLGQEIELDLRAYQLRRGGRALKLERLPMDILVLLIERRGELVSREQIAERIWGKAAYLDTDNSINGAIRKIRQVLKDDPREPRCILTVAGKGYRFITPENENQRTDGPNLPAVVAKAKLAAEPEGRASSPWARWRMPGAIVVVGVLVLSFGWWVRLSMRSAMASRKVMLAVLPFQNFSADSAEDYLSDGLTEETIAQLGRLDPAHLGVIARTSVMYYKKSQAPLQQIARELGVEYVLEGSMRRTGDRVRITAQLIQMKDQTHLWAHEYDREMKDVLTLQGEIAAEVGDEIQLLLGGSKTRAGGGSRLRAAPDEAFDLYLRGRYFWNKRTAEGFQQGIHFFEQAVEKNPKYAPAYAGLADSYSLLGGYSGLAQIESMAKARAAAQRALELDDSLPEAHTALALIVQNYDHDWETSEKEFRRAIALNPSYATAHHWYAEHLMWLGRFDEAFTEIERARQLDPLSLIIATDHAVILYYSRQYDRAEQQFRAVREMDPTFARARMVLAVYLQKGMLAEARKVNAQQPLSSPWYWSLLACIESRAGRPAEAERALEGLRALNTSQRVDPGTFVLAYAAMGQRNEAFGWMEKALEQHSNVMISLRVEPMFDALRDDPRFAVLLRRVGFSS